MCNFSSYQFYITWWSLGIVLVRFVSNCWENTNAYSCFFVRKQLICFGFYMKMFAKWYYTDGTSVRQLSDYICWCYWSIFWYLKLYVDTTRSRPENSAKKQTAGPGNEPGNNIVVTGIFFQWIWTAMVSCNISSKHCWPISSRLSVINRFLIVLKYKKKKRSEYLTQSLNSKNEEYWR